MAKINVNFDKEVILDYIIEHGYYKYKIKNMNEVEFYILINNAIKETHGWLSEFATDDDILAIKSYVENNI